MYVFVCECAHPHVSAIVVLCIALFTLSLFIFSFFFGQQRKRFSAPRCPALPWLWGTIVALLLSGRRHALLNCHKLTLRGQRAPHDKARLPEVLRPSMLTSPRHATPHPARVLSAFLGSSYRRQQRKKCPIKQQRWKKRKWEEVIFLLEDRWGWGDAGLS